MATRGYLLLHRSLRCKDEADSREQTQDNRQRKPSSMQVNRLGLQAQVKGCQSVLRNGQGSPSSKGSRHLSPGPRTGALRILPATGPGKDWVFWERVCWQSGEEDCNCLLIEVNKCFEVKRNETGNGKRSKLFRSKNKRESKIYHYKEKNKFRFLNFSLFCALNHIYI